MSSAQLSAYVTVAEAEGRAATSGDDVTRFDFGRNATAITAAVHAARSAAVRPAAGGAGMPRRAGVLDTPALRIAEHLKSVHAGTCEYANLVGRRLPIRAAAFLEAHVPAALLAALEPLYTVVVPDALTLVGCNKALRAVLCDHALPVLAACDFGGKAPKVSLMYIVMITMAAKWWHAEALRVLVHGDSKQDVAPPAAPRVQDRACQYHAARGCSSLRWPRRRASHQSLQRPGAAS